MLKYTERQTKTFQRRILEQSARDGTRGDLFWYVVAVRGGCSHAVAAPGRHVPLIWVGEDAESSLHYALIMLALFKDANPGMELLLELGTREALVGVLWYEFGDMATWDRVCPACGAIGLSCVCKPNVWRVGDEATAASRLEDCTRVGRRLSRKVPAVCREPVLGEGSACCGGGGDCLGEG